MLLFLVDLEVEVDLMSRCLIQVYDHFEVVESEGSQMAKESQSAVFSIKGVDTEYFTLQFLILTV